MSARYRFRPRFRGLAVLSIALGLALVALGVLVDGVRVLVMATGATGVILGLLYVLSPAWRIEVLVADEGIEVRSDGDRRFRLRWDEVIEVVASPDTGTCFVDGGSPDRSLLVPGPGASAPYDIENKRALYESIVGRVPEARIRRVALLATAGSERARPDRDAGAGLPDRAARGDGSPRQEHP